MRVIVVGAGVIGAALAHALARGGAQVTVIDAAAGPSAGATGASFGWINASFHLDEDHFRLRAAALEAWRCLQASVALDGALNWCGALSWEEDSPGLEAMAAHLSELGYPVEPLSGADLAALEPAIRTLPETALRFPAEAVAEPAEITARLLAAATARGAQVLWGVPVDAVEPGKAISAHGVFEADCVALCAGVGTAGLLDSAGLTLPMLPRPALLLRTGPSLPMLSHVLVTPEGELRQDLAGRLVMPAAVAHQSDDSTALAGRPDRVADATMARLRRLLHVPADLAWHEALSSTRPVPGDERPVVGPCGRAPGLYAAVMHSGITLAALVADCAAAEILGRPLNDSALLAPYRPERWWNAEETGAGRLSG